MMTEVALSNKRKEKSDARRPVALAHRRAKWHRDACRAHGCTCGRRDLPSVELPRAALVDGAVFLSTPVPFENRPRRAGVAARVWSWLRGRGR